MNLITLSFVACLVAQPFTCQSGQLVYAADHLTERQCMSGAQAVLAQWAGDHPQWRIRSYSCAAGDGREREA